MGMAKILVIDDRVINREFLITLLGCAKHQTLEAANGGEALKIMETERPDLIITDILMPVMDGYEFTQKLHADPDLKKIPVIFYTATYRLEEAQLLAKSCEVDYVLPKPSEPEVILTTVNLALNIQSGSDIKELDMETLTARTSACRELFHIGSHLSTYISDMETMQSLFCVLIEKTHMLAEERAQLISMSNKFSNDLLQFKKITSRLTTLTEFNMDLIAEHEPEKLLKLFIDGGRRLIAAKYAFLGILDKDSKQLKYFITSGLDSSITEWMKNIRADSDFINYILNHRNVLTMDNIHNQHIEIPSWHPEFIRLLCFPIVKNNFVYGFFYFADKADETMKFSALDIEIGSALGAEIAMLYENIDQYELIQRHAANLQIEKNALNLAAEEKAKLVEKLQSTISLLEASNKELEQFAYSMSHELKAPLRGITTVLEWIKQEYNEMLPDKQLTNFDLIETRIKRLNNLITSILEYSLIGEEHKNFEKVDVNLLLSKVIETFLPLPHIKIIIDQTMPNLITNKAALVQVFLKLIHNAVKFNDKREGEIHIGYEKFKTHYQFYVADNGPGIESKYHQRIFGIFQTLESRDTKEGAGMGLSIIKKIIEEQGGKIWVNSMLGQGSTFYFTWKIHHKPRS
jgi:signal transduction histidine kinase/FixJ family two-component response regulator